MALEKSRLRADLGREGACEAPVRDLAKGTGAGPKLDEGCAGRHRGTVTVRRPTG